MLQPLEGWELAYLKVCCKVQGVRKDLIAGNTLQIVKVSDLRSYFPRRTVFTGKNELLLINWFLLFSLQELN